jgi:NH3-dependent NAD+ synthetase
MTITKNLVTGFGAVGDGTTDNSPVGRLKKTTIVALARKLVALWKYVTAGVIIEGAVMKAA